MAHLAKKKKKKETKRKKTHGLDLVWLSGCLSSPRQRRLEHYRRQTRALNSKDSTLHVDYLKENCTLQRIKTKGKAGHLIIWGHENN